MALDLYHASVEGKKKALSIAGCIGEVDWNSRNQLSITIPKGSNPGRIIQLVTTTVATVLLDQTSPKIELASWDDLREIDFTEEGMVDIPPEEIVTQLEGSGFGVMQGNESIRVSYNPGLPKLKITGKWGEMVEIGGNETGSVIVPHDVIRIERIG